MSAIDYYSGGKGKKASGKATFDVLEPYSGKLTSRIAACGGEEVRDAIEAANRAFPAWAAMAPGERARHAGDPSARQWL